jgi:hypothetical protein
MNIKIGDRVKFINDVGGGIVTAFLDEKTIEVQNEDGFEIPVLATEVLLESSDGYGWDGQNKPDTVINSKEKEQPVVQVKPRDYKYKAFSGEILLAIVPENDKLLHVSDLNLYLINDSTYSIQYMISQADANVHEYIKAGILEPDTKLEIRKYNQSTLSKIKKICLQGLLFKEGLFDIQKPLEQVFDLDGVSFYKASVFSENDYFNNKAFLNTKVDLDMKDVVDKLSDHEILKVSVQKEDKGTEKEVQPTKKKPTDIEEVDLHIEAIVEGHQNLSNGEIIEIQMGRFETALETAIRSKLQRVVFIHGVGNGRLKHELRKKLERKYPDLKFQDASFKEYGYGATLVYLNQ